MNRNRNRNKTDAHRRRQVAGQNPKLLSLPDVMEMTAMSKSAIYFQMTAGIFPQPVRVEARAVRWFESEIVDFIGSRPRAGSERGPRR
jgi:prophage regulatory protein